MTQLWRDDVPALRRSRPREAKPSGIYYGHSFRDFVNQPESKWVKLYRWWDGITSDYWFWRALVFGLLGLMFLAVSIGAIAL